MREMMAVLACSCLLMALGCEDEPLPTRVNGIVEYNNGKFVVNGELAEGGSRYYGYCNVSKDGVMKFVVGTDTRAHATSSTDFYLSISGIEGPPTEGVYVSTTPLVPKDEPSTVFDKGFFKNVNEFSFTQGDAMDQNLCKVVLFAVPGEGELDPNQARFSHYVRLNCRTLDVKSSNDAATLSWIEAEFWFANCR